MVAPFLQFDHRFALVASLPALLLGNFDELDCSWVLGTFTRSVHLTVTGAADPGITSLAFADLPAVIDGDVVWLNPFAATTSRTINSVVCIVFLKFSVPVLLEVLVE